MFSHSTMMDTLVDVWLVVLDTSRGTQETVASDAGMKVCPRPRSENSARNLAPRMLQKAALIQKSSHSRLAGPMLAQARQPSAQNRLIQPQIATVGQNAKALI